MFIIEEKSDLDLFMGGSSVCTISTADNPPDWALSGLVLFPNLMFYRHVVLTNKVSVSLGALIVVTSTPQETLTAHMQFRPWSTELEGWTTVRRSGDVSRRFYDVYVTRGMSGATEYVNLLLNNLESTLIDAIRHKITIEYPNIKEVLIHV